MYVLSFFKNQAEVEAKKDETLAAVTDSSQRDLVWATLLALYILSKKFDDKESEWQLIATKAKKYLKAQGIPKPDNVLKGLKFALE